MNRIQLEPVERVEITILMDNVTDPLLVDQGAVARINWPKSLLGALPTASARVSPASGVPDALIAEPGFSALVRIEKAGRTRTLLFDTGVSPNGMVENMRRLGIDPREIEVIVLSHGHWDHVTGIEGLVRVLGTSLPVPKGKDVGGAFKSVPLCRSASQTGCVITYASFRSTIPPPANTLFGRVAGADMVAACTNPAALAGGSGQLRAYLSKDGVSIVGSTPPKPWVTPERPVDTPFVSVPGLLTAQCATNENATYLEVTVHGDPSSPRTSDIVGDLNGANGQPQANWGLHLIDVNLGMGNLIEIVREQTKAYGKR